MNTAKKMSPDKKTPLGYGSAAAILVTVGAYFSSELIAGLLLGFVPLFTGWNQAELDTWFETSVFAQFLAIVLVIGLMMGVLGVFLTRWNVKWTRIGLVRPQMRDVWYALMGYGAYFVAFIVISQLVALLVPGLDLEQEQELIFDRETSGSALWLVFASLVLLPAIFEEIIFRGFLYSGLRASWSKLPAAILTSILFAVAHLQIGSGQALLWVAALDTWVLSMILVHLREKTGGLAAPMLVHFIKNSLAFALLFLLQTTN